MNGHTILEILQTQGIQLRCEGGAIRLGPAHLVTDDVVRLISSHKTELLIHGTHAETLEQRLRAGEALIESETDPNEQQRLIDFWIDLLHRYERQVDAERQQAEGRVSA